MAIQRIVILSEVWQQIVILSEVWRGFFVPDEVEEPAYCDPRISLELIA
jgi:hypothetical protein